MKGPNSPKKTKRRRIPMANRGTPLIAEKILLICLRDCGFSNVFSIDAHIKKGDVDFPPFPSK
jgi:hypothetical protein